MIVNLPLKPKVEGKARVDDTHELNALSEVAWSRVADMVRDSRDRGINDVDTAKRVVRAYLNEV